jgi:hypothetical protein
MSFEEDTYDTIFKAMQHPIRRRILRMIGEKPATYTEIQKELNIDNGLLNYHLDALSPLITKNAEDKYTLSDFGKATTGLIKGVEEPSKITSASSTSPLVKWLTVILAVALIVSGVGLVELNNRYIDLSGRYIDASNQISIQRSQIDVLDSKLSASVQSSELVDLMKTFGVGFERAHISLLGRFSTLYSRMLVNGTTEGTFVHITEYAYVYAPRDNLTLRVTAHLESTRNIPITVFREEGEAASVNSTRLTSLEVKPDAFNEFYVELPTRGWYRVVCYAFSDPMEEYNIYAEIMMIDGTQSIPFVLRTWEFY